MSGYEPPRRSADRAGQSYWSSKWSASGLPSVFDPASRSPLKYAARAFAREVARRFGDTPTQGKRLIEVGCGRSIWLPYLARELGVRVSGLDYSEVGCDQARRVLDRAGIEGDVVHGD